MKAIEIHSRIKRTEHRMWANKTRLCCGPMHKASLLATHCRRLVPEGTRPWCSCCSRKGRRSTHKAGIMAMCCRRLLSEGTRPWCSYCSRKGWRLTHKAGFLATRCRRLLSEGTRPWCSCCSRKGRTSTHVEKDGDDSCEEGKQVKD
jgi:hypothetical protein